MHYLATTGEGKKEEKQTRKEDKGRSGRILDLLSKNNPEHSRAHLQSLRKKGLHNVAPGVPLLLRQNSKSIQICKAALQPDKSVREKAFRTCLLTFALRIFPPEKENKSKDQK